MNLYLINAGSLLVLIGMGLYAFGSVKYRLPHAPVLGNGPRGWPWQHHDWFAPRGQRYRKVGLVLEWVGFALVVLGWVPFR